MLKLSVALLVCAGLSLGSIAAHAKLPAPPPQTDAEKAAAAEKAKLAAEAEAALLAKYQELAVANYNKNKGMADNPAAKDGVRK